MNRPLILITNDDGVQSKGIATLVELVRPLGDVLVVAPDGARSGHSNALTLETPLSYKLIKKDDGLTVYSCSGTPTDCAKLAFYIAERRPDVLFAGINHGSNTSINTIYSGTMGATFEGCVQRVPAVGFSLCEHGEDLDFSKCLPIFGRIAKKVVEEGLPAGICLNVNAPTGELKGAKICRQGRGHWENEFEFLQSPAHKPHAWMAGNFVDDEPTATDTDSYAIANGYVAIVPSQIDTTAHSMLKNMKDYEVL